MVSTGAEKKRFVREKFAAVTERYDLLNSVLSLSADRYWRWVTIRELAEFPEGPILDLCAGTLPLSAEIVRQAPRPVAAVDFCIDMLRHGAERLGENGVGRFVIPICGDGEELPLVSDRFKGITVAFGVRNLSRADKGLREMLRVLAPGGKLAILEFSRPKNLLFAPFYRFYLHRLLPKLAGLVSGDEAAYRYLADSIQAFYDSPVLATMMEEAGFRDVRYRPLTMGVVTLYTGRKNGPSRSK